MKKNRGKVLILLGLLLVTAALSLTGYNLYEGFRAKELAGQALSSLEELIYEDWTGESGETSKEGDILTEEIEVPDYVLNPEMEVPTAEVDGIEYIGILRIPALGLELPVIGQWSYWGLRTAPCRYEGSPYLDNLVIAAHNYQSHFGMLKSLLEGDEISFTDVDGNLFVYEVKVLEILAPTAVEEMVCGDYDLTLFTCTYGGESRITLRCDRIPQEKMP